MRFYYIIIVITLMISPAANLNAQQETAVIPYKIDNPTDSFTIETGKEYAKLVSLAAGLTKRISIISHAKVDGLLKKNSLNSQRTITENDIIKTGTMGNADYILVGTLAKRKGTYTSDSILYSLKKKKIISKSHVSSRSLFKLAGEETKEIFFAFSAKKRTPVDRQIDSVIVTDLSYKISEEWDSVKNGIKDFANTVSENWNLDTEISIIPFSDKFPDLNKLSGLRSYIAISEKLDKVIPAGNNSLKSFEKALSYSVKNYPWRLKSEKLLIIISNSDKIEGKFFEQYALNAKLKRIAVYTVSLGLLKEDSAAALKQFASAGSGQYSETSYHQSLFNEKGDAIDIFFQGGRIFHSLVYDDAWKNGLFEDKKNKFSSIEKPKSFLNEILYDDKKYNINPYNLSKYYPVITQTKIINSSTPENNIASIMHQIGNDFSGAFGKIQYKKPIAKALITGGNISLWIQIKTDNDLNIIKNNELNKTSFPLGVTIKKSANEPYGIAFDPDLFVTGFGSEFLPELIKTDLSTIIKNPDKYTSSGLLTPPVWFIDVKADKIEILRREYDIREGQ
ncbi:MAG: vWA domain-containing protein [Spirochaetota bacterium]